MAQPATSPKIEELRAKLKSDPKSRMFYPLAEELRKVGGLAEAEQVLRAGLVDHATYLSAWVSLGRVLRDQKNDRAALEPLAKALQLDPGNVVAARLMADAYLALGEKIEAIKKYKLVLALMPGDEETEEIVAKLDAELNPPVASAAPAPPPPAATPRTSPATTESPFAAEESPFAAEESPFAAEESPFASESQSVPLHAATTEMPLDVASEETPFAPVKHAGEETANLRAKPLTPPPAEPASEPEPFAERSSEVTAAHADESPMPFGEPATQPVDESVWATEESQVLGAAEEALHKEVVAEQKAGDDIPMAAAHAESPFEEQQAYSTAALEVEAPPGVHVTRIPLAGDVAAEITSTGFPPPEAAPIAPEPVSAADESDVFAPAVEPLPEPGWSSAPPEEDLTNTLTMADLYAKQGLVAEAAQIYENILQRDPSNDAVRQKLAALTTAAAPPATESAAATAPPDLDASDAHAKAAKLERWLSKVGKREGGRV